MREFEELMVDVLMCDREEIPHDSTPLRDLEGWDSLKHVQLVVGLENKVKTKLTAEEIQGIVTLADVAQVLRQKGINA